MKTFFATSNPILAHEIAACHTGEPHIHLSIQACTLLLNGVLEEAERALEKRLARQMIQDCVDLAAFLFHLVCKHSEPNTADRKFFPIYLAGVQSILAEWDSRGFKVESLLIVEDEDDTDDNPIPPTLQ